MSKKPEPSQKQIPHAQREAVLKLADLQKELRDALHANLKKNGCTLGAAAGQAGVDWKGAHGVYTGTRALGGGRTLKRLTAYLGKPQLETAILDCTVRLNDRLVGLSVLEKKHIQTVFDVHEIFHLEREARKSLTLTAFSRAFDEQQEIVFGILNWQVDAVRQLNDEAASAQFEEFLTSKELSGKITKVVKQETDEQARLAAEFRKAGERLLRGPIVNSKLAQALGISASNVGYALSGCVPQARLTELIGQINQKLEAAGHAKEDGVAVTQKDVKAPEPSAKPSHETARLEQTPTKIPTENRMVNEEPQTDPGNWPMGGTSEEGVPFVLDQTSFTPFAYRPAPEDIKYTARQIQHLRSLLNVLTQISDDGIRETVRLTLGPEVEELAMTLRLFTEEFPNRMLGLFDAERQTMKALGLEPGKPARKEKR